MFWPPVRILNYAELAFAVSSPELGDTAFLDQICCAGQTVYYVYLEHDPIRLESAAKAA
jgi:hypothetical protein